jgi:hypothetical protein
MAQELQLRSGSSGAPFVADNDGDTLIYVAATGLWTTGPGGGGGAVASVFGRAGVVVAVSGDYDSDEVTNVSGVVGVSVSDALDTLAAGAAPVSSVFARLGAVVAAAGDYDSDQVDNASGVAGATVSAALDALDAAIVPAPVSSVFGRTGAVVPVSGDYTSDEVDNASTVPGTSISDALDNLAAPIAAGYSGVTNVLVLGDAAQYVPVSNGAANTLEVPPESSVNYPIGTWLIVVQTGVGQTTLLQGTGVTVHPPSSRTLAISDRYGQVFLKKIASNEWWAIGTLGA